MGLLPDVRDLIKTGSEMREARERTIRVAVFIDAEAPDAAVEALKEAMRPKLATARMHVEAAAPGDVLVVGDTADAVIALTGPGDTLEPSLFAARDRYVPAVALALGEDREDVARRLQHPVLDVVTDDDAEQLMHKLGAWIAERVGEKRLAFAANFSVVRRAVAVEAVKSTAFQNAVIGGVMIVPGADMPLMTANQGKMLLQIAAAYGQPLGAERVKELAAVVGGGFAMRAVARQALSFVPGFGWAIKAGIGYTGTLAMGYAAVEYFEGGGSMQGLGERVRDARDRAIESARGRLGRSEPPIDAHAVVVEPAESAVPVALPPVGPGTGEQ